MISWYIDSKEKIYPNDKSIYQIGKRALDFTRKILEEYRTLTPSNEGLIYWAGLRSNSKEEVRLVVAPKTESGEMKVMTSPSSNAQYVKVLAKYGLVHIGQVHSHPGSFIDHSDGDDEWTPFKRTGLISIVAPNYGRNGLLPLTSCAVHKYINSEFKRLDESYILERFQILTDLDVQIEDLRP